MNPIILADALHQVIENSGAGGVDGLNVESIKGREWSFCVELAVELKSRTFKPQPVRRVFIPKANGQMRPLGIPTIKDRVVQTALKLLLEAIYEERFLPCSYGFRPGKRAYDCAADVADFAFRHRHVLDCDIKAYFDNVQHKKLLGMLKEEIVDPRIIELIRIFLKAGVQESNKPWQPTDMGTPQGGPLSPLGCT